MIISFKNNHFPYLICLIALFLCLTTPVLSIEPDILFSGTPPAGDKYYTASIACSNLDGIPGDEIIITDDFGSFQILKWNILTSDFTEDWVSDPVFETSRVKEIFALNIPGKNPFLIFRDSANNLRLFNKQRYVIKDVGEIFFDGIPASNRINDFAVGEFNVKNEGWELVTLRCGSVNFGLKRISFGILNTGHFTPELHQQSSNVLFNINSESNLEVEHFFSDKSHGLLIIPNTIENEIVVHRTSPPFNSYSIIEITDTSKSQFGWAGQIRKSGNSYLTAFIRDEDSLSRISFFNLDAVDSESIQITIPSNSSKWVLADLDGDDLRELVVLDFLSNLHIYDLSGMFPNKNQS